MYLNIKKMWLPPTLSVCQPYSIFLHNEGQVFQYFDSLCRKSETEAGVNKNAVCTVFHPVSPDWLQLLPLTMKSDFF